MGLDAKLREHLAEEGKGERMQKLLLLSSAGIAFKIVCGVVLNKGTIK